MFQPRLGVGQSWVKDNDGQRPSKGRGNALENTQCNGRENVWRILQGIEGIHLREQGTHGERKSQWVIASVECYQSWVQYNIGCHCRLRFTLG